MSTKITNMIESERFDLPNKRVKMIEVFYVTDRDYKGSIMVEKDGATKDSITKAVNAAAALSDDLLGATLKK